MCVSTICATHMHPWLSHHGETILTIGRLLGHNDPATTLKYKHLADAAVHEAAETLVPVLGRED